jgi:hypothetical protein
MNISLKIHAPTMSVLLFIGISNPSNENSWSGSGFENGPAAILNASGYGTWN